MTKTATIMTADELRETAHDILVRFLEQRGWDVADPHGWGESDCTAYDAESGEVVLLSLEAEFQAGDDGSVPELSVDEVDIERGKSAVHAYIGEHPDATAVRYDIVSMTLFDGHRGRIRHLVGAYSWEEQSPRAA